MNLIERNSQTIADSINELHGISAQNAFPAGKHNFYRGAGLKFFYADTKVKIKKFSTSINSQKAIFIIEQALKSQWEKSQFGYMEI